MRWQYPHPSPPAVLSMRSSKLERAYGEKVSTMNFSDLSAVNRIEIHLMNFCSRARILPSDYAIFPPV